MPIKRFEEFINQSPIPLIHQQKGAEPFKINYDNVNKVISVERVLRANNILHTDIFNFVIDLLLQADNHTLPRGNGRAGRLGSDQCPIDSIEGLIASRFYNAKVGDAVFRRISAVANILVAAGICAHGRGVLKLRDEFKN